MDTIYCMKVFNILTIYCDTHPKNGEFGRFRAFLTAGKENLPLPFAARSQRIQVRRHRRVFDMLCTEKTSIQSRAKACACISRAAYVKFACAERIKQFISTRAKPWLLREAATQCHKKSKTGCTRPLKGHLCRKALTQFQRKLTIFLHCGQINYTFISFNI